MGGASSNATKGEGNIPGPGKKNALDASGTQPQRNAPNLLFAVKVLRARDRVSGGCHVTARGTFKGGIRRRGREKSGRSRWLRPGGRSAGGAQGRRQRVRPWLKRGSIFSIRNILDLWLSTLEGGESLPKGE